MPVPPTYPGVSIAEGASTVRTIVGVATSITAFVGRALRGPVNRAVRVRNFDEFERIFGGLWTLSSMSYAVQQFFLNGGTDAIINRVAEASASAAGIDTVPLVLEAANVGSWGGRLQVRVDTNVAPPDAAPGARFNLFVRDGATNSREEFRNLSVDPHNPRYVRRVLEQESQLLRVSSPDPLPVPAANAAVIPAGTDPFIGQTAPGAFYTPTAVMGGDGLAISDVEMLGVRALKTGIFALEDADVFNLLCLPPPQRGGDTGVGTYLEAVSYCEERRAMLLVDPRAGWVDPGSVLADATGAEAVFAPLARHQNAIVYFPMIRFADPLRENRLETFVPSGAVAGVISRTDATRGVWKAPAGLDAGVIGARELSATLTDGETEQLSPLAINCIRAFPVTGTVVWGARTWRGADRLADQWKYLPVRRLALFIEESLYRGTQWAVFEPNDEPLWSQLRLNVGSFMHDLFRRGAFQGASTRDAYVVKCDKETTTQGDINQGVVNILVGFAPLKPAEFVIIRIQQLAGNIIR